MALELFLQVHSEAVRRGEDARGGVHGEQPVGVHHLEAHVEASGGRSLHARHEEARPIVAHHHAGPRRKCFQKALAVAGPLLGVWEVGHVGPFKAPRIVRHALEEEGVQAVAGERVVHAQGFEDDQRLLEVPRVLDRPVQREVGLGPPERRHPVEDEVTPASDGVGGERSDADGWDRHGMALYRGRGLAQPSRPMRAPFAKEQHAGS